MDKPISNVQFSEPSLSRPLRSSMSITTAVPSEPPTDRSYLTASSLTSPNSRRFEYLQPSHNINSNFHSTVQHPNPSWSQPFESSHRLTTQPKIIASAIGTTSNGSNCVESRGSNRNDQLSDYYNSNNIDRRLSVDSRNSTSLPANLPANISTNLSTNTSASFHRRPIRLFYVDTENHHVHLNTDALEIIKRIPQHLAVVCVVGGENKRQVVNQLLGIEKKGFTEDLPNEMVRIISNFINSISHVFLVLSCG